MVADNPMVVDCILDSACMPDLAHILEAEPADKLGAVHRELQVVEILVKAELPLVVVWGSPLAVVSESRIVAAPESPVVEKENLPLEEKYPQEVSLFRRHLAVLKARCHI